MAFKNQTKTDEWINYLEKNDDHIITYEKPSVKSLEVGELKNKTIVLYLKDKKEKVCRGRPKARAI